MGEFVKVAQLSEVPPDTGKRVLAGGVDIALFRIGDEVFATDAICPHQGGALDEGGLHGEEIMCPWHGWEFNIKTGRCGFNPKIKIRCHKVKQDGEDILLQV